MKKTCKIMTQTASVIVGQVNIYYKNPRCLNKNVVYLTKVKTNNGQEKIYIGSTKTLWKECYNNHKASFRNEIQ